MVAATSTRQVGGWPVGKSPALLRQVLLAAVATSANTWAAPTAERLPSSSSPLTVGAAANDFAAASAALSPIQVTNTHDGARRRRENLCYDAEQEAECNSIASCQWSFGLCEQASDGSAAPGSPEAGNYGVVEPEGGSFGDSGDYCNDAKDEGDCKAMECSWTGDLKCISCENYDEKSSCDTSKGCTWTVGETMEGCEPSLLVGIDNDPMERQESLCELQTEPSGCSAESGCFWDEDVNICEAADCAVVESASKCNAQSSLCEWIQTGREVDQGECISRSQNNGEATEGGGGGGGGKGSASYVCSHEHGNDAEGCRAIDYCEWDTQLSECVPATGVDSGNDAIEEELKEMQQICVAQGTRANACVAEPGCYFDEETSRCAAADCHMFESLDDCTEKSNICSWNSVGTFCERLSSGKLSQDGAESQDGADLALEDSGGAGLPASNPQGDGANNCFDHSTAGMCQTGYPICSWNAETNVCELAPVDPAEANEYCTERGTDMEGCLSYTQCTWSGSSDKCVSCENFANDEVQCSLQQNCEWFVSTSHGDNNMAVGEWCTSTDFDLANESPPGVDEDLPEVDGQLANGNQNGNENGNGDEIGDYGPLPGDEVTQLVDGFGNAIMGEEDSNTGGGGTGGGTGGGKGSPIYVCGHDLVRNKPGCNAQWDCKWNVQLDQCQFNSDSFDPIAEERGGGGGSDNDEKLGGNGGSKNNGGWGDADGDSNTFLKGEDACDKAYFSAFECSESLECVYLASEELCVPCSHFKMKSQCPGECMWDGLTCDDGGGPNIDGGDDRESDAICDVFTKSYKCPEDEGCIWKNDACVIRGNNRPGDTDETQLEGNDDDDFTVQGGAKYCTSFGTREKCQKYADCYWSSFNKDCTVEKGAEALDKENPADWNDANNSNNNNNNNNNNGGAASENPNANPKPSPDGNTNGGGNSGEVYTGKCWKITGQQTCDTATTCFWDQGTCVKTYSGMCAAINMVSTCEDARECRWSRGTCIPMDGDTITDGGGEGAATDPTRMSSGKHAAWAVVLVIVLLVVAFFSAKKADQCRINGCSFQSPIVYSQVSTDLRNPLVFDSEHLNQA